jgi:hypothetical protein
MTHTSQYNETFTSIKGRESLENLSDYQLLKKGDGE